MISLKISLSLFVLLNFIELFAANANKTQRTGIVFETEDTNKNRTATHNRKPVLDKGRCDTNSELLYPGDNDADWVCDCKPSFLFYPATQKCYPAYTKGPCPHGEILTLSHQSSVPKCEKNSCDFGKVRFQDSCSTLNGEEGCKEYQKIIGRKVHLVVDPTTLQLTCRDEDDQFKCANNCCIGSTRFYYGKCDNSGRQ
ncbi:hypothetical protein ACKWTF_012237 [Chironomus riparius]